MLDSSSIHSTVSNSAANSKTKLPLPIPDIGHTVSASSNCSVATSTTDCTNSSSSSSAAAPRVVKRVHFDTRVRVRYTLHLNNFTPAERRGAWLSSDDVAQTRFEMRQAVEEIQAGIRSMERGLEFRTRAAAMRRKSIKNDAKAAVLDEQALQNSCDGDGEKDDEYIACLYMEANRDSSSQAGIRGLMDEQIAQRVHMEECHLLPDHEEDDAAYNRNGVDSFVHEQVAAQLIMRARAMQQLQKERQRRRQAEDAATNATTTLPQQQRRSSSSNSSIDSKGRPRRLSGLKFFTAKSNNSNSSNNNTEKNDHQNASRIDHGDDDDDEANRKWKMGPLKKMLIIGKAA
mmetsp:Transcript_12431/g.36093  ORF Transcript_12431/g.36093 Transcript_12431/m.36093 type:complete len:345 (+) Transcript_12431:284-1318(+)